MRTDMNCCGVCFVHARFLEVVTSGRRGWRVGNRSAHLKFNVCYQIGMIVLLDGAACKCGRFDVYCRYWGMNFVPVVMSGHHTQEQETEMLSRGLHSDSGAVEVCGSVWKCAGAECVELW